MTAPYWALLLFAGLIAGVVARLWWHHRDERLKAESRARHPSSSRALQGSCGAMRPQLDLHQTGRLQSSSDAAQREVLHLRQRGRLMNNNDECSIGLFHTYYPNKQGQLVCSKCGQPK